MVIDGNIIKAEDGMKLTDGVIYGSTIRLGEGRNADEFYEITEEEYDEIIEKEEQENII